MRRKAWSVFGTALLLSACDLGGQTGDFSGQDDDEEGPTGNGCLETETPVDLADDSALGFSAEDVLAFAEQGFTAPLAWQTTAQITYGPESGTSELTISLTRSGEAWYVVSEPRYNGNEGPAIAQSCPPPRLRIGVEADVQSAGGALAERFVTKLDAASTRFATFSHELDAAALGGSFQIESISPPEAEIEQLSLAATLSPAGMTGTMSAFVVVSSDEVSQAGGVTFAAWPASDACPADLYGAPGLPVEMADEAFGLSGDVALAQLNESTPVRLRWANGASSDLTLTASQGGVGCLRLDPYAHFSGSSEATITYPITLRAISDDGRLDGTYAAKLSTSPEPENSDHRVSVEVQLPLELERVADTGLRDLTLPAGLHRLMYLLTTEVDGLTAIGSLKLNGLTDPPCVTDPPEPEPGSNSSPGCEGTKVTEVESAYWPDTTN